MGAIVKRKTALEKCLTFLLERERERDGERLLQKPLCYETTKTLKIFTTILRKTPRTVKEKKFIILMITQHSPDYPTDIISLC